MVADLESELRIGLNGQSTSRIETASSLSLPLGSRSVDCVIGSPPYCTRIDYAVTTSVELAYLGHDITTERRDLRHSMIGTSTVRSSQTQIQEQWGPTCCRFLRAVKRHPSKASESYYFKTHLQYFDDVFRSLREIERVLKYKGTCVLVLQDSFYKDIHNDLPKIVVEMADAVGLHLCRRDDFLVALDMGRVNPKAHRRRVERRPVESVVHFTKQQ
ncbi:MAG: hypothetical protein HQ582_14440 [Planctomycetes bacterium]|nr:hypothetical protein [Planctomycetota bacterium]